MIFCLQCCNDMISLSFKQAQIICLTIIPSGNITSSKLIEDVGRPQCVPLPHCKTLHWIWRHRSKLPGIDQAEVEKYVFSLNCGAQVKDIQFVSLFHITKFYLTQKFINVTLSSSHVQKRQKSIHLMARLEETPFCCSEEELEGWFRGCGLM